jgi:hypothetical protein
VGDCRVARLEGDLLGDTQDSTPGDLTILKSLSSILTLTFFPGVAFVGNSRILGLNLDGEENSVKDCALKRF